MARQAVVNASPLILLSRGNHAELLRAAADKVTVPSVVEEEILRRHIPDVTVTLLQSSTWIEIVQPVQVPEPIVEWGLGPGESAVLAYAWANPGVEVIIDDLMGRKCARAFGMPVRGTLGLVLSAKKAGRIPCARAVMENLMEGGLYLSRSVLDEALKRVGE